VLKAPNIGSGLHVLEYSNEIDRKRKGLPDRSGSHAKECGYTIRPVAKDKILQMAIDWDARAGGSILKPPMDEALAKCAISAPSGFAES
jgi:hypothetical protein